VKAFTPEERETILTEMDLRIAAKEESAKPEYAGPVVPLPPEVYRAGLALAAIQDPGQDEDLPMELLVVQRRFFENVWNRATQLVNPPGTYYPNPRDGQTNIMMAFIKLASMEFCSVPFFGERPKDVDECATRMNEAENGNKKRDRLIDDLQDMLDNANEEVNRLKGGGK